VSLESPDPSKGPAARPSISVVVPTPLEPDLIPPLLTGLGTVRERTGLDLELLLMDDRRDGSRSIGADLGLPWVRRVTRTGEDRPGEAVLDGLRCSRRDVLVVMDPDLSHSPEAIPEMLDALEHGADFVIGARTVEGGSNDGRWSFFPWLERTVATLLARPLASLKDPLSGFFALRRTTFERGRELNPIGGNVGLELLVKCGCTRAAEVPIRLSRRSLGKRKLSLKEELRYLRHLRRLYIFKYGTWAHLVQFLAVGATGVLVNVLVLTALLAFGVGSKAAVALAIVLSMVWNFVLNRRFSFSYARSGPVIQQLVGFVAACSVGAVVNYFVTLWTWDAFRYKQLAAVVGVVAGTAFNFVTSRFLVFRRKHMTTEAVR